MPIIHIISLVGVTLILSGLVGSVVGADINCQRPPQLVDPALCCQDGGRDDTTENCAKRLGITGQSTDKPPTVEVATCLAECILTESGYMPQPEQLNLDTIRADLQRKFANDTGYVNSMVEAFAKCAPSAQRKMQSFKQELLLNASVQGSCSPFSGILLSCTYMEYFKTCPVHRWTESEQCATAKKFVQQCGLGV